jgi:phosphonate transport system substrate-binding protein
MFQRRKFLSIAVLWVCLGGCAAPSNVGKAKQSDSVPLKVGAIPDQDPEELQRLYSQLTDYLSESLEVPVTYQPVTDYTAAVTAFRVGDLDLVWFGGLTGVQARLQVADAQAIAQRDIDAKFTSVFIAHKSANLSPLESPKDLQKLKGLRMTFGSDSSTSGRLMPQYFLKNNDVGLEDFKGDVGFSGTHDKTIKLVESGTYEVGALNSQVWRDRLAEGKIDTNAVQVIWETPPYYDYHWVINPAVEEKYGKGFTTQVQQALLDLDATKPEQKEILDLFTAAQFIPTKNQNYAQIEAVGRDIGKIK